MVRTRFVRAPAKRGTVLLRGCGIGWSISLARSLLLSHPTLRLRGRLSLPLRMSSSRTRNRFGVVSRNRDGRSTARFVGRCARWLPGRLNRRSLRSDSIFVAWLSVGWGKGFDFWRVAESWARGTERSGKWRMLLEGGNRLQDIAGGFEVRSIFEATFAPTFYEAPKIQRFGSHTGYCGAIRSSRRRNSHGSGSHYLL